MNQVESDGRRMSQRFRSSDADVIFLSSDDVLFYVHRKYLEVCTQGLLAPEYRTPFRTWRIVEVSDTLELLFQFIYPQRNPSIEGLGFDLLSRLAEAAEKYSVFHATDICRLHMKNLIPMYPLQTMLYGVKYDYPEIVDLASPFAVGISQDISFLTALGAHDFLLRWLRYEKFWTDALQVASAPAELDLESHTVTQAVTTGGVDRSETKRVICDGWGRLCAAVLIRLGGKVGSLKELKRVFAPPEKSAKGPNCAFCLRDLIHWRKEVEGTIVAIPKFSDVSL